jgi:hypothetical protein
MRTRWKVLGGAGLVGVGLSFFIVIGHSRVSRGDTSSTGSSAGSGSASGSGSTDPNIFDPSQPYGLGPHPISYDELSTVDKAGVDSILQKEELSQPPSSYAAWADAAAASRADAQAQIAARNTGLVGTAQDGVTP